MCTLFHALMEFKTVDKCFLLETEDTKKMKCFLSHCRQRGGVEKWRQQAAQVIDTFRL